MWTFIGVIVGALFGERAGNSIGELAGVFFALVGLAGGGYLGAQIDNSFEIKRKQKYEDKLKNNKNKEDENN
jgi:uncharacterized protein YcfJ